MSSGLETYSPLPILRLLLAPRTFVVLIGGLSWTLGGSYFGAMARFKSMELDPRIESAVFGALLATLCLFGLSALVGLVIGEAAQEVFRRPMLNRLPGMALRFSRGALVLGAIGAMLGTAIFQLAWAPLELRLSETNAEFPNPLATFSIACMGFAAGSWLLTRVGHGWGWLLRLFGFAGLASVSLLLLSKGTESIPIAFATLIASLAVASQRFRTNIVRKMAEGSVPTVFGSMAEWVKTDHAKLTLVQRQAKHEPPITFGTGIDRWRRANAYLWRTTLNWIKPMQVFALLACFVLFGALLIPIAEWHYILRIEGQSNWGYLKNTLFRSLPRVHGEVFGVSLHSLWPITAAFGLVAYIPVQFMDLCFHPIPRIQRARLMFRSSSQAAFVFTATLLILCLGLGLLLALLGERPYSEGLPLFLFPVLAGLLLYPAAQYLFLHLRRSLAQARHITSLAIVGVFIVLQVFFLNETVEARFSIFLARAPLLGLFFYLAALFLSFGTHRLLLERYYSRTDLLMR